MESSIIAPLTGIHLRWLWFLSSQRSRCALTHVGGGASWNASGCCPLPSVRELCRRPDRVLTSASRRLIGWLQTAWYVEQCVPRLIEIWSRKAVFLILPRLSLEVSVGLLYPVLKN